MRSTLKKSGEIHNTPTGYDFTVDAPLTARKAIRQKCLDCCNGMVNEVKLCGIVDCTLWPLRMGRGICVDPRGEKVVTSGRKGDGGKALAKWRESKEMDNG
jgi:hypothetical protein